MTRRSPKARELLWRAIIHCAGSRWRSLLALRVPAGSGNGREAGKIRDLVRKIQARAGRRLPVQAQEEHASMEGGAGELINTLQVELAFQQLQLAEQRLLLGDGKAAQLHCRGFVNGLLAAAYEVLGEGFVREEHDLILATGQHLSSRLATQLDLRQAVRSGALTAQLIFVLGMHRSGTSALSGMLCKAGFDPPEDLMHGQPNNPLGHWESVGLCKLNDELFSQQHASWRTPNELQIDWEDTQSTELWRHNVLTHLQSVFAGTRHPVIKDPRFCILLKGITPWLESGWIQPSMLLVLRDPIEVVRSLEVAEQVPPKQGIQLWLHHVFAAESISRSFPRLIFSYDELLQDPARCLEDCRQLIGNSESNSDSTAGTDFVTLELHRQRRAEWEETIHLQTRALASISQLATAVFSLLRDNDLNHPHTMAQLDGLAAHWRLLTEATR